MWRASLTAIGSVHRSGVKGMLAWRRCREAKLANMKIGNKSDTAEQGTELSSSATKLPLRDIFRPAEQLMRTAANSHCHVTIGVLYMIPDSSLPRSIVH